MSLHTSWSAPPPSLASASPKTHNALTTSHAPAGRVKSSPSKRAASPSKRAAVDSVAAVDSMAAVIACLARDHARATASIARRTDELWGGKCLRGNCSERAKNIPHHAFKEHCSRTKDRQGDTRATVTFAHIYKYCSNPEQDAATVLPTTD